MESASDITLVQWTTKQEAHCFSYGSITNRPPAPAVRDFFAKKGYVATVRGYILSSEVVFLDSEIDPVPMLEDVEDLPGVSRALLHFIHRTSEKLDRNKIERWTDERGSSPGRAIIEVGRLEDGSLYEFGTMLLRYDEKHTAAPAVEAFFRERGYGTPAVKNYVSGYYVIDLGNCVDRAPMLEGLRAIPDLEDVLLNQLHPVFEL